jgi:hypothetical protein
MTVTAVARVAFAADSTGVTGAATSTIKTLAS